MSSHSFSDITQAQWKKACIKLELIIEKKQGKGSHFLARHPQTGRKLTIQKNLYNLINMKIFKKLLEWGFKEEDIWKAL